jgi:hypothetical protein
VRIALLLLLAGCGRLDFTARGADASADTITGHDEDGDGIPDAIDPCPWVASDMTDSDGDGVGDACDPDPGQTDTLALFAPLTPDLPVVFSDGIGSWSQRADTLYNDNGGLANTIPQPLDHTVVEVGFEIDSATSTFQHQIALGTTSSLKPFYFVELNDNMGAYDVAVSDYDGTSYNMLASQDPGAMHPGVGLIRLTTDGTPSFTIDAGWVGQMYHATAATPGFVPGVMPRLILNGLEIELRYIAVIQRP